MQEEKHHNNLLGGTLLTICAVIWGTSFIAQSLGASFAEPFTYNFSRSILATIFLLICSFIADKWKGRSFTLLGTDNPITKDRLLKGGIICGICLTAAIYLQQLGIMYTTVGKSGFITALYIILVPILAYIAYKRKINLLQGISVLIAAIGMYFICINEAFTINIGDFYTFLCSICFAVQIICVENIITNLDGIRLSMIQFFICTVLNGILMLIFESPDWPALFAGWGPIAYSGIMSSGIAYTLQILGQKHTSSVLATMIMSLESVFALLSGWLYLGQAMTLREIFGCVLVFAAIMLAQLPIDKLLAKKE